MNDKLQAMEPVRLHLPLVHAVSGYSFARGGSLYKRPGKAGGKFGKDLVRICAGHGACGICVL